jgi:hypothetical protein
MTVEEIVKLFETSNVPDYGLKTWQNQPTYFKEVLKYINLAKYKDSLYLELGVFTGLTLNIINQNTEDIKVYGFDTFTGLPEDWAQSNGNVLFEKNYFTTETIPENNAKNEFIVGKVEDTLATFLKEKNQKIKFIHLDLDLYSSSKSAFETIFDWLEDEAIVVVDDVYNLPSWEEYSIKSLAETFDDSKYEMKPIATCGWKDGWASMALRIRRKGGKFDEEIIREVSKVVNKESDKVTIVTGLWDLGRGDINGWAKRDFQQYKNRFFELLKSDAQMCIWIPKELEQEVLDIRGDRPTKIYIKELKDFKLWFPFFDKLQEIRTNPEWYNSAGWLPESPQAALEFYNPMMMCKMFMVNDSAIMNPFNSKYFYWIDGGLTSTVSQGYFNHDNVFNKLKNYTDSIDKVTFITYPYEANSEIHGFERTKIAEYCGVGFVNKISRGGFWGGKKEQIHALNSHYYSILQDTIINGYMGADECLFTILTYRYPDLIQPFEIEGNGLVWPFFEMLNNTKFPEITNQVALYVIGFNFPNQLDTLCKSFEAYDKNFLEKPKKYLLNNSTDRSTDQAFAELCQKYDFEEIKKDNIGICGGRQFCAEHADENGFEYHMFFEDDMFFYNGIEEFCRNGFKRKIQNFYDTVMHIVKTEKFDFLKFNFSEFYGDNTRQWSWHNIPDNVRQELFPENPARTDGDILKAPYMKYNSIKSYKGVPYATGEVFYCNWPQVVSREGNRKMFIETKYSYPFEQTWMSHFYQDTVRGKLNPGILLATPTEHNRFEFYTKEERREN